MTSRRHITSNQRWSNVVYVSVGICNVEQRRINVVYFNVDLNNVFNRFQCQFTQRFGSFCFVKLTFLLSIPLPTAHSYVIKFFQNYKRVSKLLPSILLLSCVLLNFSKKGDSVYFFCQFKMVKIEAVRGVL